MPIQPEIYRYVENMTAQVADFGIAKILSNDYYIYIVTASMPGTLGYMNQVLPLVIC